MEMENMFLGKIFNYVRFLNSYFLESKMAENIKQLVRLGDADLKGDISTYHALTRVKGVGYSFSNVICKILKLDFDKKVGLLTDNEVDNIKKFLENPAEKGVKSWLLNRNKDYDTGKDVHLISSKLKLAKEFDIKRMKEVKSYRGMRHAYGLPVRGQRTKAHFRKGSAIGVKRKGVKQGKK